MRFGWRCSRGALALLAGCQLYSPYRDANGRANEDMAGVINPMNGWARGRCTR